jgi:hypothetical protein
LHYIFYWTSWVFSVLTGLAYLASVYVGRRLPCGYFWIGFLSRSNGLLRMGAFSELIRDGRELQSGFTFDVSLLGTTKNVLFIQYLGPPPEQLQNEPDQQPAHQGGLPIRNALMLLACVSIYILPRSHNTDHCAYLHLVSRSVCIVIILPSFAHI